MKIKNLSNLIIAVVMLGSLSSCESDKETRNAEKVNYALSTTGGTWPDQTTYLFGTNEFPSGTLGTSNAAELSSNGSMYKYGSDIYMTTFGAPATLRKYVFDDKGLPREVANFSVAGLKTFGAVEFVSATEAYASANGVGGVPKLVKFNPTNMQIITMVDLTGLQKAGATNIFYQGMVIRDNFIYLGINYQAGNNNLEDKVFIGIINRTTNKVEKVIEDDRSNVMWVGGTASSFSPNTMIKDANNDIYVLGFAANGKPSGVLKIKSGTTEFDPGYFFNLDAATGKPCLGLYHFANGLTFTIRYSNAEAYPFDYDYVLNKPYAVGEIFKIDLTAKTSSGNISATLPKIFGVSTFMTKWDDDKIYFNVSAANSNSVYSYTINGGAVAKEFDLSSGTCNGFTKIN